MINHTLQRSTIFTIQLRKLNYRLKIVLDGCKLYMNKSRNLKSGRIGDDGLGCSDSIEHLDLFLRQTLMMLAMNILDMMT